MKAYLGIIHRGLEDDGCDFWWIDWQQGEHSRTGIDPLWLLNHYHFLDSAHDGCQPLIPYLHTMNIRAASDDEPLVQPMYWKYPALEEAYKPPNQYTFGSELMVCPVTKPRDLSTNLASVRAWFPPGAARYVDIFTGLVYDGGRELEIFRPLGEMPVFAAEGSIIPLNAAAVPENGGHNPSALEVIVIVGKSGRFEIVENRETTQMLLSQRVEVLGSVASPSSGIRKRRG